jgi:mono/diheme cytochrome c family protein
MANGEVMQAMPGFRTALSAQQVADLVNYMRNVWGGQPADITSADIERTEQ